MSQAPPVLGVPAGAFAPLHTYEQNEAGKENTRLFYGDGTEYLRCPGLLSVEKVRAAGVDWPAGRVDQVMLDASGKNFGYIELPQLLLDTGADGVPILRRSRCSNDGNWQNGYGFFVSGEWDPKVPPVVPEEPKPLAPLPPGAAVRPRGRG